jgi:hypothetical protein
MYNFGNQLIFNFFLIVNYILTFYKIIYIYICNLILGILAFEKDIFS